MSTPPLRWARRGVAALAIGFAGLGLAACGDSGEPADLAAGKQSYISACSSCHALADADAGTPTIGPNLDDSWRASRQAGFDDSQFQGTIERWIRIAQLPMPRDLVTGQDAKNVAAYIASVAGRSPESGVYPAKPAPEIPDPPRLELN